MSNYKNSLFNILIVTLLVFFVLEILIYFVFSDSINEQFIFAVNIIVVPLFIGAIIVLKYIMIMQDKKLSEHVRYQHQLRLKDTRFAKDIDKVQTYVWEIDRTGMLKYVSDSIEDVLGYKPSELINKHPIWFLNPKPLQEDFKNITFDAISNHKSIASLENPVISKDGQTIWVVSGILPVFDRNGFLTGLQGFDINVTEAKDVEVALIKSERKFRTLFETMGEAFVLHEAVCDEEGNLVNYRVLEVNEAYEQQSGLKEKDIVNQLITDIFNVDKAPFFEKYEQVFKTGESVNFTRYFGPLKKYFRVSIFKPLEGHFGTIFSDITEQTTMKATIEHLSYHDKLTGLYNRRYYEEQLPLLTTKENMPLSVLLCDLNALKLANDAFGHKMGDQVIQTAAEILVNHKPPNSMAARIGGDEFAVLMPKTSFEDAVLVMKDMKDKSINKELSHIFLSMSFGLSTLENSEQSFDMVYRKAENKLYAFKLKEGQHVRQNILTTIIDNLHKFYLNEASHAKQVSTLSLSLGKAVGLSRMELSTLKQVALYHDIGKIGVDKDILNKANHLSDIERLDVERHPEIGYRILSSLPNKAHLAEHVLNHHENIDGSGYPRQLTAKHISKFSKIIRICESYDTMICEQPYKIALSKQAALKALKDGIGTLYDEHLTQTFINMVSDD